ncbi:MAG: nucleotide-binding protein [Bacteroidetes bacterium]|nr:MAG: nucleotide-binding protein [Bacteroidota bacterium]
MNYLLDTNILLIYIRDEATRDFIEKTYDPFGVNNNPIISIVTVGEIRSLAKRNHWGKKKMALLNEILGEIIIADINSEDVIEKYAEIDAFSQGRLNERPLSKSARNMGKNDLWIAAIAEVTKSTLMTTDNDFDHLDIEYFKLTKIVRKKNI